MAETKPLLHIPDYTQYVVLNQNDGSPRRKVFKAHRCPNPQSFEVPELMIEEDYVVGARAINRKEACSVPPTGGECQSKIW